MKKLLQLIMVACLFVACSGGDDDPLQPDIPVVPNPEKESEIKFSTATPPAPVFSTEGGSSTITFTATDAWTASVANVRSSSWCNVSPTSGAAGNATITVTTQPNETHDDRSAAITLKCGTAAQTFTVSQKQKDALTVTQNRFDIAAEGGEVEIEVKANISFEYKIDETAASWIKPVETRAMQTTVFSLHIEENEEVAAREGTVTIISEGVTEIVTICQAGTEPVIVISEKNHTVTSRDTTLKIEVASNVSVDVTVPDANWIREDATRAMSTHTYYFNIAANEDYDSRIGEIVFLNEENALSDTVTITQMQANALIVAKNMYNVAADGETLLFDVQTNVDFEIALSVDWITHIQTRALRTEELQFEIAPNEEENERKGTITLFYEDIKQEIAIVQNRKTDPRIISEREALIEFYNSTGGNGWIDNTNWCTELSVDNWYGITTNSNGYVIGIGLSENNLSGKLPESIGNFESLEFIYLRANKLTGRIPESIGNLDNLKHIHLCDNGFTGYVPESIKEMSVWRTCWPAILENTNLNIAGMTFPAPEFSTITTIKGKKISDLIYRQNELTVLFEWASWCSHSKMFTPQLQKLYEKYKEKGLGVLGYSYEEPATINSFILEYGITWDTFQYGDNNKEFVLCNYYIPSVNVVDSNGEIIFNCVVNSRSKLEEFLKNHFGDDEQEQGLYESTDYSKDGEVTRLQKATVGNGIDIVLMGDAYSDRLIADGTYQAVMEKTADELFAKEPYKSYRDMFNVYMVNVVSKNEVYEQGASTALETYFGDGTLVGGEDATCFEYAMKAISEERLNQAMIVVMMNKDTYAGTCWMYYPSSGDYGNGVSVSYFPTSSDDNTFAGLVHHEANGHGFAKLADEYAYQYMGAISEEEKTGRNEMVPYGWWKNVDFTSSPALVKWSKFLSDSRYANEGLGVYEGGFTYWSGVWRPTENSIMRDNTGSFNAPSREAIYYRIHKLAYGNSWKYDYETFVEYDSVNRSTVAAVQAGVPYRVEEPKDFVPLHEPVVVGKSWREVIESKKTPAVSVEQEGKSLRPL